MVLETEGTREGGRRGGQREGEEEGEGERERERSVASWTYVDQTMNLQTFGMG